MVQVVQELCMDCGGCVGSCHVNAITLLRGQLSVSARCDECNMCVRICPVGAILTAPGGGIRK